MSPGNTAVAHSPATCLAIREVLDRVGDKWSVLLVVLLTDGPRRFNDLRRSIEGISQRMLTHTLKALERDGLVTRTVYSTIPPKVEYALTDLGNTLLEPITALADWARGNGVAMQQARARYDRQDGRLGDGANQETRARAQSPGAE
jgi:DNA-binding HxlR family transcriptional regulator